LQFIADMLRAHWYSLPREVPAEDIVKALEAAADERKYIAEVITEQREIEGAIPFQSTSTTLVVDTEPEQIVVKPLYVMRPFHLDRLTRDLGFFVMSGTVEHYDQGSVIHFHGEPAAESVLPDLRRFVELAMTYLQ
jgi:hypothetical protein